MLKATRHVTEEISLSSGNDSAATSAWNSQTTETWNRVTRCRKQVIRKDLAQALEDLASNLMKEADMINAAVALEEAAEIWREEADMQRLGSCLILATSSRRLAMDLDGASKNLQLARQLKLPKKIKNGFWLEACEQLIASGSTGEAYDELSKLLEALADQLEPEQHAQILQRRAAVAISIEKWSQAASDFLAASRILLKRKLYADAEACSLAAAAAITEYEPEAAEQIVSEIQKKVPRDGAATVTRGLVSGRVALEMNDLELAMQRFDDARQGAVDICDPISYFSAVIYACEVAELSGDLAEVYSRLARAWASLSELLDADSARKMIKPELEKFRDRIGNEGFALIKSDYEAKRKQILSKVSTLTEKHKGKLS